MNQRAIFGTEHASRHLETLCRHFGKKVETTFDAREGCVQFPFGRCEMKAEAGVLELRASAEDQGHLDKVVDIMTSHLERFAFRENPSLDWQVSGT